MGSAHGGERCPPEKGFIDQYILGNWGFRVEKQIKWEGKQQFSVEEDIHNRKNSQARVHAVRGIRRVKVAQLDFSR